MPLLFWLPMIIFGAICQIAVDARESSDRPMQTQRDAAGGPGHAADD
jgi:hypothetical protein